MLTIAFEHDPPRGGQGIYARALKRKLPKDVHVYKTWQAPKGILSPLLFLVYLNAYFIFLLEFNIQLPKWIKQHKVNAVHFVTGPGGPVLLRKVKATVAVQAFHSYALSKKFKGGFFSTPYYTLMEKLEKITLKNADVIFALSEYLKQELTSSFGVKPERIHVLPIPPNDYFKEKNDISKENFILFVGRLERRKGIFELVEALTKTHKPYKLVMIGSNYDTNELKDFISRNQLDERVRILPPVDQRDLVAWYNKAQLCIMPSHFEPQGFVALEAIRCGTPCIVPRTSGAAELISKVDPELIIPDTNPVTIAEAIERNYGKKITNTLADYTWDTYIARFNEILNSSNTS